MIWNAYIFTYIWKEKEVKEAKELRNYYLMLTYGWWMTLTIVNDNITEYIYIQIYH